MFESLKFENLGKDPKAPGICWRCNGTYPLNVLFPPGKCMAYCPACRTTDDN